MRFEPFGFFARTRSFLQILWALPVFFLLTLVPWLLAAHALLLSRQFYEAGREYLGATFKIAMIVIAGLTAFGSLWFVAVWLAMLVRCVRGPETKPGRNTGSQ
ncbi:MAG: hypothetical protein RKR03_17320 [Candidatus Competibacter sp.]|nr:hypothetical protein [Candidatus Competibacter sp.]